jgi:hypothetical protein
MLCKLFGKNTRKGRVSLNVIIRVVWSHLCGSWIWSLCCYCCSTFDSHCTQEGTHDVLYYPQITFDPTGTVLKSDIRVPRDCFKGLHVMLTSKLFNDTCRCHKIVRTLS